MRTRLFVLLGMLAVAVIAVSVVELGGPAGLAAMNESQRNDYYAALALDQRDAALCENMRSGSDFIEWMDKLQCYGAVARETLNTSLCSFYPRYDSTYQCVLYIALKTGNGSLCEGEGMERDDCYIEFARTTGDLGFCDRVSGNDSKIVCITQVAIQSGDPGTCEIIGNVSGLYSRDSCYVQYVLLSEAYAGPEICERVADPEQKAYCLGLVGGRSNATR
jgi:hypothetical protein